MGNQGKDRRPDIAAVRSAEDVTGWYWTRAELCEIARHHGVSTQGSKDVLTGRIAAALGGVVPASQEAPIRASQRLVPPFAPQVVVPAGQPFTRELRDWMAAELGGAVRVTQPMRDFLKDPQGGTLGDLVALAEQPVVPREIPRQFELNRFMRIMASKEPHLTRSERLAAWREFRQRPSVERERYLAGDG